MSHSITVLSVVIVISRHCIPVPVPVRAVCWQAPRRGLCISPRRHLSSALSCSRDIMQSSYSATQRWSSANAALEQRNAVLLHHRNIAANEPSIRQTQPVPGHGPRTLGVIVYLTQARHSSYGRDSLKLLRRSVEALVENYLAEHNDDVIFLHYGEVPRDRQDELIAVCGSSVHARFLTLNSSFTTPPPGTPPQSKWMHRNRFSPGYRHMIRLFAIGLWPLIAEQGYEYVMRMDEDSFILSRVRYNFFEFMRSTGIDYAYRLASWEAVPGKGHPEPFHHFVRGFLRSRPNLSPTGYSGGHLVIWSRGGDGITVARNGRRIEEKCEPCACDFYLPKKDGGCVFHPVTASPTNDTLRPCRKRNK